MPQHPGDGFVIESALCKEAPLPAELGRIFRPLTEAPGPDLQGTLTFVFTQALRGITQHRGVEAVSAQFEGDAETPEPLGASADEAFDESRVGKVAGLLELVEHAVDLGGIVAIGGKLAGQLDPTVLAHRKPLQRPCPQGEGRAPPPRRDLGVVFGRTTRAHHRTGRRRRVTQAASSAPAPPRAPTP